MATGSTRAKRNWSTTLRVGRVQGAGGASKGTAWRVAAATGFVLLLLAFTIYMGISIRRLMGEEKLLAHRQLSSWVSQQT